ncbi:hypothetical protein LTSEMIS_1301, partial [Salmonella enterica subsp. enterica serovar Mississippi str. A4-633]
HSNLVQVEKAVAKMSGFRFVQVPMRRWSMVWHMS